MKVVGFDLDDTLIPETLFIRSGIRHISGWLSKRYHGIDIMKVTGCMEIARMSHQNHYLALESYLRIIGMDETVDMREVVDEFRNHMPYPGIYHLFPYMESVLSRLKASETKLVMITDGRSSTQRHKIEAAGLERFFDNDDIFISGETGHNKYDPDIFLHVMRKYSGAEEYHYVGDNPEKDFIHPSRLGWKTHLTHGFPLAIYNRNQGMPR